MDKYGYLTSKFTKLTNLGKEFVRVMKIKIMFSEVDSFVSSDGNTCGNRTERF